MEMNLLYNVPHEFALSPIISTLLLSPGRGRRLLAPIGMGDAHGQDGLQASWRKSAAVFVVLLFSGAPVLLIMDLGQPLRFWYLMTLFNVDLAA